MQVTHENLLSGCACCSMNRRKFLTGCAAACAAGGLAGLGPRPALAAETTGGKPRVRLVFTHVPSTGPIWPNIGYDFDKRKKELTEKLRAGCPGIEFIPTTVMNVDEANKLVADSAGADGYLVYMVGIWTGAPQVISSAGRPTLFVDDLYGGSGEFLIANAFARRAGHKTAGVSSADMSDVISAARCFEMLKQGKTPADFVAAANAAWKKNVKRGDMKVREDRLKAADPGEVIEKLKKSTLLVVGARNDALIKGIADVFGTKVIPLDFKELDDAYLKADREESARWAEKWIKAAQKTVEPSRDEVIKCGAMYLAEKELMKKHGAQGISINCLGGFYGGHIKAYPCLGFSQLNDDGLVGACEADLISTITMLAVGYLTGRPGYISDPVLDTSRNQIIYAHCVASTRVFGPEGTSNPYHIRSHSEDRKGAVVRSLMPLGYMTTSLEFHPMRREVLVHQGKTVDNIDEDKACRTKLAAEVKGDIDKLMNEWDQWSWHRVTVYGDAMEPVRELAKALKLKVVEEA